MKNRKVRRDGIEDLFLWNISEDITGGNGQKSARNGNPRRLSTASRNRQPSAAVSAANKTKSSLTITNTSRRKREQQNENLQIAITELLNHFSHRNLDAIVRVIRMTLEKLRKRITTTLSYGRNHREAPVFKVFAELAIPNITIQPSTDEVQGYLHKAVTTIVSISKSISQWNKDRQRVSAADVLKHDCHILLYSACNRTKQSTSSLLEYTAIFEYHQSLC